MRRRLDTELVRRGLARSRDHAGELIAAGAVAVTGIRASKAASQVDGAAPIVVTARDSGESAYASRGAHKLVGALDRLTELGMAPRVEGAVCLDAGASTGGFTDVLLRRGAKLVHAVDVGYGQLAWRLRSDERVVVHDRTNVRYLTQGALRPEPSLVVADLSFISLTTVLPALIRVAEPVAGFVLMVKPQFEVGKDRLPAGGVVQDPAERARAVMKIVQAAKDQGLSVGAVVRSPLPGPSGNVEFFIYASSALNEPDSADLARWINQECGLDQPGGGDQ